uniref:Glycosyltransferase 2-like domain-containing protein n=1 Tax=Haptolina brevifila TaxID=156173 RepID=A0A7S2FR71_9EUKA
MNAVVPTVDTDLTMILDADHHINEQFAAQLVHAIQEAPAKCCCMQGSVLIRGDRWDEQCLGALCWYFFSIVLPAFETLSTTTMFIGAGAVWKSEVLKQFLFDSTMIAEDDDLSMRVIRAGYDIKCCPPAELTELACDGILAFFAQRFRWTYGYEQSLNKHICGLVCDRPRALLQRLYSWYGYMILYGSVVQGVAAAILKPTITIWTGFFMSAMACGIPFMLVISGVVLQLRANEWRNWQRILPWIPVAIAYAVFQAIITIYARLRMFCGITWRVTERKLEPPAISSTASPTEGSQLLPAK